MLLTRSPIDPAAIIHVTPLGGLNPPSGHVFPNFHAGFKAPAGTPVVAPGDGVIWRVTDNNGQRKIDVAMALDGGNFPKGAAYYLDHVVAPGLVPFDLTRQPGVPQPIHAGKVLGEVSANANLDLGTFDPAVQHFLQPDIYAPEWRHATAPLRYFPKALALQLYQKTEATVAVRALLAAQFPTQAHRTVQTVPRLPTQALLADTFANAAPAIDALLEQLDGRCDWDARGTLSGNWFRSPISSQPLVDFKRHLSICPDHIDRSRLRLAVGDSSLLPKDGAMPRYDVELLDVGGATVTLPTRVTAGMRPHVYQMRQWEPNPATQHHDLGFVMVEVLPKETIRVDVFGGLAGNRPPTAFRHPIEFSRPS